MSNRLGELLIRENLISSQQLQKAQEESRKSGGRLGYNLTKLGYIKESDLTEPGPSQTWVFTDEHPDSINDGGFGVQMPTSPTDTRWVDVPTIAHNGACGFSFADGHSEIHKWVRAGDIPPMTYRGLTGLINSPGNPDILWLAKRTSAYTGDRPLPFDSP